MSLRARVQMDAEKAVPGNGDHNPQPHVRPKVRRQYKTTTQPFIGRLGGNQEFALDESDSSNATKIKEVPDAAPCMSLREQLNLGGFSLLALWKAAILEGMASFLLCFITIYISLSPNVLPIAPTAEWGPFANASFIGPLVGGLTNWLLVTLFTYTFGGLTGAHLNPLITMATFFARLCSLPRMVLYISFQTAGASLAGLMIRAAYGSRDFKTGGCFLFTEVASVSSAWVLEFMAALVLLFLAFGVGLDPRQKMIIGPSLGPFLVGMTLGVLSFGTAFAKFGSGGAGLNPARCFGAFVGSRFPGWHWIHWIADLAAAMIHGVFYFLIPPWEELEGDQANIASGGRQSEEEEAI